VTASFNTLTFTPGVSTAQLTLTASASAAPKVSTPFIVSGSSVSQPVAHTASANVQVDSPPSVVFTSPAAGVAVNGVVLLHVRATPGTNANLVSITMSVDNDAPLSASTAASTGWDTLAKTSNGTHTLKATVLDDDGATASTSVDVNVQNSDFGLALSPQSLSVPVGGSASFTVKTTLAAGSAEPVTLNLTGLPTGLTASFSPSAVTAGGTATLTLTAPKGTAAVPTSNVNLTGTSPSQPAGHTLTASVSIETKSAGGCASSGASSPTPGLMLLLGAFLVRRRRALAARSAP
jgi:MYXO-CTERM domain-containing protein